MAQAVNEGKKKELLKTKKKEKKERKKKKIVNRTRGEWCVRFSFSPHFTSFSS